MLVLSRKKNESIVINNDVIITVVEIRGDKVRLGIVAPKEVPVHREEVYEATRGVRPPSAQPAVVRAAEPAHGSCPPPRTRRSPFPIPPLWEGRPPFAPHPMKPTVAVVGASTDR